MGIGQIINIVSISLTCLFFAIVLMNITVGFCRGFKSSLKHLETMTLALLAALGMYYSIKDGGWIFSIAKNYLPNYNGESGASEYVVNYAINMLQQQGGEGGIPIEYFLEVRPLAEGVINLGMLLVTIIFYFLFLMIFNSLYWFIRTERKKKKEGDYRALRFAGASIYLVRSLLTTFLVFSIIGSLIYMTSGGKSHVDRVSEELDEANFLDMHHLYSELNDKGIMKYFGLIKNKDNEPFYFFLTDMLIKSKTKDADTGKPFDVYPRVELASISRLVFDLYDLGKKYQLFEQERTEDSLKVFNNNDFDQELNKILDHYKESNYLNNFFKLTYNNVKKMIETERDKVEDGFWFYQREQEIFVDKQSKTLEEAEKELMKQPAYDKTIPYVVRSGSKLKETYESLLDVFWPKQTLYSIKPIEVFNVHELKLLLKASSSSFKTIFDFFMSKEEKTQEEMIEALINIITQLDKNIRKLTLLNENGEKRDAVNAMYQRLLKFVFKFADMGITFDEKENLNYMQDINSILGTTKDLAILYREYKKQTDIYQEDIVKAIEEMFQEVEAEKSPAETSYDSIIKNFNTSPLVNKFLSSDFFNNKIASIINDIIKQEIAIPRISTWLDQYDGETLVRQGEFTIFTNAVKNLFKSKTISQIMTIAGEVVENLDVIKEVIHKVNELNIVMSDLAYYMMNAYIANLDLANMPLVIPNSAKVKKDGITLIDRDLLKQTMKDLETILTNIDSLSDFGSVTSIIQLLQKEEIKNTVVHNKIFNLTVANQLVKLTTSPESPINVKIPIAGIFHPENEDEIALAEYFYITNNELGKFIDAINTIDLEQFAGGDSKSIISNLIHLTDQEYLKILDSKIFHLTITDQLVKYSRLLTNENLVLFIDRKNKNVIEKIQNDNYLTKKELTSLRLVLKILEDKTGGPDIFNIKNLFGPDYDKNVKVILNSEVFKVSLALTFIKGVNTASASDSQLSFVNSMKIDTNGDIYELAKDADWYKTYSEKIELFTNETIEEEFYEAYEPFVADELKNLLDFINAFDLVDVIDSGDYSQVKDKLDITSIIINKTDLDPASKEKIKKKNILIKSKYLQTVISRIIRNMPNISVPYFFNNSIKEIRGRKIYINDHLEAFTKNPFFTVFTKKVDTGIKLFHKGEIECIIDTLNKLELDPSKITSEDINFSEFDVVEKMANLTAADIDSRIIIQTISEKLLTFEASATTFKLYYDNKDVVNSDYDFLHKIHKDWTAEQLNNTIKFNYGTKEEELLEKNRFIDQSEIINLAKAMLLLVDGKEFVEENILVTNLIKATEGAKDPDQNVKDKLLTISNSNTFSLSMAIYMNNTITKSTQVQSQTKLISPKELEFTTPLTNVVTELELVAIKPWLAETEIFNPTQSKDELRKFLYALYKLEIQNIDGNNVFKIDISQISGPEKEEVRTAALASSVLSVSFLNILNDKAPQIVSQKATDVNEVLNKEIPYVGSVSAEVLEELITTIQ